MREDSKEAKVKEEEELQEYLDTLNLRMNLLWYNRDY